VIISALCFAILIQDLQSHHADTIVISPSGRFLIENVPVNGVLMPWGGMSYLRITDIEQPMNSYRTPLYETQHLDMRANESSNTVGIYWIDFSKPEKTFEIGIPSWENHWLNIFISNTPYTVSPN
jgi:hypothetical protein